MDILPHFGRVCKSRLKPLVWRDNAAIKLNGGRIAVSETFNETIGIPTRSANSTTDLAVLMGTLRYRVPIFAGAAFAPAHSAFCAAASSFTKSGSDFNLLKMSLPRAREAMMSVW